MIDGEDVGSWNELWLGLGMGDVCERWDVERFWWCIWWEMRMKGKGRWLWWRIEQFDSLINISSQSNNTHHHPDGVFETHIHIEEGWIILTNILIQNVTKGKREEEERKRSMMNDCDCLWECCSIWDCWWFGEVWEMRDDKNKGLMEMEEINGVILIEMNWK